MRDRRRVCIHGRVATYPRKRKKKKQKKRKYIKEKKTKKKKERIMETNLDLISNLEAEKAVLGGILVTPSLFDEVSTLVNVDDFYYEQNKQIYNLLNLLVANGGAVDIISLVDEMKKKNIFEDCGQEAYLGELMTATGSATNVPFYCKMITECAMRRRILNAASDLTLFTNDRTIETKKLLSIAEEKIFAIGEKKNFELTSLTSAMMESIQTLDNSLVDKANGLFTGFDTLDDLLGGLRPSELIIVAARPGMGKTAFATNVASYVASECKKKVLFFSLEMSKTELANRVVCSRAFLSMESLRGTPSTATIKKYSDASSELYGAPLFIDDTPSRTVTEIASICRREKRKNNLDLVIIDYIGLIEPDDAKQPRQEQVARIARRLKLLAKETNVPVICCAQLNRNLEQTKDNRPKLSHLRESGAIEQDADVVILLHREEYYITKEEAEDKDLIGRAEIIVAKHRNGRTGSAFLKWSGDTCQFLNDTVPDYDEFENYSEDGNGNWFC